MPLVLFLAAAAAQTAPSSPVEGRWINPGKDVIIAIAPCADRLCGTVEWASEKAQADARKGVANLIGAQLLTDLQQRGDDSWKGKLFVPDRKMRVSAKISPVGDGQLRVSGCTLGGVICDTQLWTRSDGTP